MGTEARTTDPRSVEERLDRLYAELADLKRQVILGRSEPSPVQEPSAAPEWQDLLAAAEEVSAQWEGLGAAEEIRSQRGV